MIAWCCCGAPRSCWLSWAVGSWSSLRERRTHRIWYANLVSVDGRTYLLLTHAGTLFTLLAPDIQAGDLRTLHGVAVGLVERELAAENLPTDTFGRLHHDGLHIAVTADRSVLGCMNDMAFLAGELISRAGGLQHANIDAVNRALRRNINSSRGYTRPIDLVLEQASRGLIPTGRSN